MKAFQYTTAGSVAAATELAANGGRYFAGGVDLLGEMKEHIAEPNLLVNIKSIPGLQTIEPGEKLWTIGASVTVAEIEDHAALGKFFPGLQQAAAEVGSRQIRNVATVGGNLAQHSRCWYYRQRDVYCLKRGGDTCYARKGENKYHSLFTGNTCISPVVSNLAVALAALSAEVIVQRGDRAARLSVAELYAQAWENPTAHHSLQRGDFIVKIEIPVEGQRSSYLQVSEKSAFDWALVSCAAAAKLDRNVVTNGRVVLGAVANVPYQVQAANALLAGQPLDEQLADRVADLVLRDAQPQSQNAYKLPIARTLIRRALMKLKEAA
jgi:xanthine dehydrogenase YagS FAD-binding subunit